MEKEIEHRKGKDLERRTLQARMPFSYNPDSFPFTRAMALLLLAVSKKNITIPTKKLAIEKSNNLPVGLIIKMAPKN
jgi:hypothetical protein